MKKITILIILILLVFSVGIAYSIYFSSADLSIDDQNVAKFVFNAQDSNNIKLSLINMNPKDKKEYFFSVSNNDNGSISEVTIQYQIMIKTYHFIPFNIMLYKLVEDEDILVSKCDESYTRNEQNQLVCSVPVQEMKYSLEKSDNYKLVIEFPEDYNDESYSGLVDFIDLEINSKQKIGN